MTTTIAQTIKIRFYCAMLSVKNNVKAIKKSLKFAIRKNV